MGIKPLIKNIVRATLKEDVGKGDVTTNSIVPAGMYAKARIYTRKNGVVAGLDIAIEVFRQLDPKVKIRKMTKDGDRVAANQTFMELRGKARALLTGERSALNFLQHLSGIATLTRDYVEAVKPHKVKILCTRKTIPGMRVFEKYAVRMGGGYNHRMGLWDMAMVKDNHLKIGRHCAKDEAKYTKEVIFQMRKKIHPKMKVEVEAINLAEVRMALEAGADVIMLDNMDVTDMKKAARFIRSYISADGKKPIIEASGNVKLENIGAIAETGVDWISVGRLTHSAPILDISMKIEEAKVA